MKLVQRIVEEVANREDVSQADLPPLYENLDTEALQALVESTACDRLAVEFVYCEYVVRVGADGDFDVWGDA